MRQQDLIRAALEGKATCVIKNANVVNVFTGEIVHADVALYEDVIIGVGAYSCENEIDARGWLPYARVHRRACAYRILHGDPIVVHEGHHAARYHHHHRGPA